MEFLSRQRFALGFALVLALVLWLVLAGRWAMFQHEAVNAPATVEQLAARDDSHKEAQPPEVVEAAADPGARPDDPASSRGALRGRVIDAVTRQPVREFDLKFQDIERGYASAQTRTFRADDGRFEWRRVLPEHWILVANARGYQRFELNSSQVASGKVAPELVLPLRPGHKLRGRVYDEISRIGIAAASISFRDANVGRFEGNWRSRAGTTSGKDGSFVLDGVPPGRVTLEIDAQDYAGRELDVFVDKQTSPVEIGLSSGGTIAGRLTAADGVTPVAGSAGLFRLDQGFGGASRTSEAGEFSYQHLVAGRYRLTGQARGATVTRDIVLASNERIEGIVLALGAGHSIRGTVTGLRPELLRRVSIRVERDGDGMISLTDDGVDERGAYVLNSVAPGRVKLVADVSSHRQLSRTIDMPADADVTVNFDFPSGARLFGRVTRGGKPLAGVWVEPQPAMKQDMYIYGTSTAGKGEYVIEDLAAGEYTLLVDSYASRPVQVSGDTLFDIDVPLTNLSGRVLEAASQVPVVEADVDIWSAQADSSPIRLDSRSDHFGQFAFAGLEPGDFILTAYKPGYEMVRQRISYSAPTTGLTISLRQSRGIEITVREAGSGKPLRQVEALEMIGDGNGSKLQLRLDENGIGYIPEALTGSTLSFSAYRYAPTVIRAWSGQELDVQLSLQAR